MKISVADLEKITAPELIEGPAYCTKKQREQLELVVIDYGWKYSEMLAIARSVSGRYIKQIGELYFDEIEKVIDICRRK